MSDTDSTQPVTDTEDEDLFTELLKTLSREELLIDFTHYTFNIGKRKLKVAIPPYSPLRKNYSGIIYDDDNEHWTAKVNGVTHDPYNGMQKSETVNFCQSYACYLWATKGKIEAPFKRGHYVDNIKEMSQLWLTYFSRRDLPASIKKIMRSKMAETKKLLQHLIKSELLRKQFGQE
jgi:hypothetical protein